MFRKQLRIYDHHYRILLIEGHARLLFKFSEGARILESARVLLHTLVTAVMLVFFSIEIAMGGSRFLLGESWLDPGEILLHSANWI